MASKETEKRVMTEEHKKALTRNLPTLMTDMNLTTSFWAILLSLLVLTDSEVETIRGRYRSDDEQVFDLVQTLKKKPDNCYFYFLEALKQTGQLHLVALLELRQMIASGIFQLTMRKSLLRTCCKVETWTWSQDKRFVPIGEMCADLIWVKSKGHSLKKERLASLGNYTDMFKGEGENVVGYVFLQGLAGSGKSTLVQMLIVKWCGLVTRRWLDRKSEVSEQEESVYSKFKYVLLIFLRYVKEGMKIQDVIENQYCVESETAAMLYNTILQSPKDTLIVLEGYDEYTESTSYDITNIAHRKIFKESTLFITSRHSPSYHFHHAESTPYLPDNHILLKGFSPEQISLYVNNFFKNVDKNQVDPLLATLKRSEGLLNLGRLPANLLLMCTLWEQRGSLSDTITGFFEQYVTYVCGRYKTKFVRHSERSLPQNILEKYHKPLMQIGEFCTERLTENHLQVKFMFRDLFNKIGDTVWELGFLEKESSITGEDIVVFPHKIVQEFITAYFIVNCGASKRKELLMKISSSVSAVQEYVMVHRFIGGLGGEPIRKEIEEVIHGLADAKARIIPMLQLSFLSENVNAQLKLPPQVFIEFNNDYSGGLYERYFSGDCSKVTHLTICDTVRGFHRTAHKAVFQDNFNMVRLANLKFEWGSMSALCLRSLCEVLQNQSPPLTTLYLWRAVPASERAADWPLLMDRLPVTLQMLVMSYNDITDQSVRHLSRRLCCLKELQVIRMDYCKLRDPKAFLELITKCDQCPNLTQIDVHSNKMRDGLVEVVNVTEHMKSLRKLWLHDNDLSGDVIDIISRQLKQDLPQLELPV